VEGETFKARERRIRDGFFDKYCVGKGIDIGCFDDPLLPDIERWDLRIDPNMDAQYMRDVPDESYDFVYSSHCLEDLPNPSKGLFNWWRILKPGGYLTVMVPHRDLFERRITLPSPGNSDHKWYFLMDHDEPPVTLGLIPLITKTLFRYDIEYVKKCSDGYGYNKISHEDGTYSLIAYGEYSIEAVIRKRKPDENVIDG
jgi:SAM-dependent methyltransferase